MYELEYLYVLAIFVGVVFGLILIALVLDKIFPKNKFSEFLFTIVEWIRDNITIP